MVPSWPGQPQWTALCRLIQFFILQRHGPFGTRVHPLQVWASCAAGAETGALVGTTSRSCGFASAAGKEIPIIKACVRLWQGVCLVPGVIKKSESFKRTQIWMLSSSGGAALS